MKKVFIDIGGHFGESVEKFYNEVPDAEEWIIYSFEPLTFEKLIENTSKYSNVTVIPAAAWIEEGELDIYIGERKEGLGSTVLKGKRTGDIDYAKPVKAKAIDANTWLSQLQADYIVMKVNIEGGEYVLLPYLIENNVFTSIDELYVETHAEKFDGELGKVWKDVEKDVIEDLKKFKTRVCLYINKKYVFNRKRQRKGK